jgi:hypothetical protein
MSKNNMNPTANGHPSINELDSETDELDSEPEQGHSSVWQKAGMLKPQSMSTCSDCRFLCRAEAVLAAG